mmetsp:Transcript_17007/g.49265  ORF Transcript_17007/g.49265 Transcript_17007/m.49265 type:complete len:217 (+) Transcript_17007:55-705(+)
MNMHRPVIASAGDVPAPTVAIARRMSDTVSPPELVRSMGRRPTRSKREEPMRRKMSLHRPTPMMARSVSRTLSTPAVCTMEPAKYTTASVPIAWEKKATPRPRQTIVRTTGSGCQATSPQPPLPLAPPFCPSPPPDASSAARFMSASSASTRAGLGSWARRRSTLRASSKRPRDTSHLGLSGTDQMRQRMIIAGTQPSPNMERQPPATPKNMSPAE